MKKLIYWIGAFVTVAAIFGAIAVMLKKLRISLSIETIDDTMEDDDLGDIDLTIEDDNTDTLPDFDETAGAVEEALEDMLDEESSDEIHVEITAEE